MSWQTIFTVYFRRRAFISRSAFDANTSHNRFSDAELRTKKLILCLHIISVTSGRLKAVHMAFVCNILREGFKNVSKRSEDDEV